MPHYTRNGFAYMPIRFASHFLCFPLTSPSSRLQFQESFHRSKADPSASNLSLRAIRPIGTLQLAIGVMSLISPVRIEAASKYLHELDVNSILRAIGSHERDEIHQNGNTLRNQASLSTRSPGTFPIRSRLCESQFRALFCPIITGMQLSEPYGLTLYARIPHLVSTVSPRHSSSVLPLLDFSLPINVLLISSFVLLTCES